MKFLLFLLTIFFLTSTAIAEETIYPKDLPKVENFDERGLEIIQKQFVDEGHQPWRSYPTYYAKFFMNFYYPDLDPNEREKLPAKLTLENIGDNRTAGEIVYDTKKFIPDPHDSEWDKMPVELKLKSNRAIVKVVYNGKEHAIYLHKAFLTNPESIWIVEKMEVK